ncbi:MAG TPA: NTP transferase domain-containing protein [Anaerolineae bacterium]|nr:NTP transferase domain-containing protein [Anaerolineae bacterium]HQI85257.1 NTP transferase domain-containing protein [Anaerolineae bacterium]
MIDCIVLAGGVPQEEDLLYAYTQGRPKALIDVAGKPLVQWVLDALDAAPSVRNVVFVGLTQECGITSPKISHYVPDQGSMLKNILAGIDQIFEIDPATQQVLISSSDIPMLTGAMVETFLAQCADPAVDIYHSIVPREKMEQRFPGSRRSYVHFSDGDFAAGDIHVVAPRIAHAHEDLWNDLLNSRKNALKQAARLGPAFFAKLMARRLSLAELERLALQKLGLNVRAMIVDYAEMGMDADKPFQLEICRQELAR